MNETSVATTLVAALVNHGVTTVFALPGEENLDVVEALRVSPIDVVVTRHEQHAAFMAATMGRLTGTPGVCLATLGPGATNLFTGLAHAQLGGYPMIAITGQKPLLDNSEGSFQVVDVVAAAKPLVKQAVSVRDPLDMAAMITSAFRTATSGRPGAVLIELPEDVAAMTESRVNAATRLPATPFPNPAALAAAAERIDRAARPLFLVSEHANREPIAAALAACAQTVGIGIVTTQAGKGAIDEAHPLAVAALGIHRPDYSHHPVFDADLIVTIGYDPVEHPPLSWNPDDSTDIIHCAAWPAPVERGYRPALDVVGDLVATLDYFSQSIAPRDPAKPTKQAHVVQELLNEEPSSADGEVPSPLDVVRVVRDSLDPTDVVALDNGAYKVWFARHYVTHHPQTLLLDNALATMGAGLATAMTAGIVNPNKRVLAVCGDGGFLMNIQDLETANRLDLDLTVLVVRDDTYGFIGWHQDEQDLPRFAVELANPDICALATAFGATSVGVATTEELRGALDDHDTRRGLHIIDCLLDYSINELLGRDLYEDSSDRFSP